jgi:hypothetical protein
VPIARIAQPSHGVKSSAFAGERTRRGRQSGMPRMNGSKLETWFAARTKPLSGTFSTPTQRLRQPAKTANTQPAIV